VLVSLHVAKGHLRIPETDYVNDADVSIKLLQAEAIILGYLKSRADASWTEITAPKEIQAAILLMTAHLYEHRGDDPQTDADLWMAIDRLVIRFRDPALA
jgi:hypothetical protein